MVFCVCKPGKCWNVRNHKTYRVHKKGISAAVTVLSYFVAYVMYVQWNKLYYGFDMHTLFGNLRTTALRFGTSLTKLLFNLSIEQLRRQVARRRNQCFAFKKQLRCVVVVVKTTCRLGLFDVAKY